jgi:hypothetical protein
MKNILKIIQFGCLLLCFTKAEAQTADEIIDKYIQAIGGKDAWSRIHTIKQHAILNANGTDISFDLIAEKDKGYKQTISFTGLSGYSIYTPTNGWNYYPWQGHQKAEAMTEEDLREAQDALDLQGPLIEYKTKGHSVEYLGKDDFEGTECYKIKLNQKSGKVVTYYIDPSNYFLIHSVTISKANGQENESKTDYSNYKKFPEGIWMPMNVGTPGNVIKIVKSEINVPIEENTFKPSTN